MDWSPANKQRKQKKQQIQNKIKRAKTVRMDTIAKGFSKAIYLQLSRVQH